MDLNEAFRRRGAAVLANRIERGQYVTHADLLRIARKNHCRGIHTEPVVGTLPPDRELLGLQGHRLQVCQVSRLCRLRRRPSWQRFAPDLQSCRIANGRGSDSQSVPSEGLSIVLCSLEGPQPWALSVPTSPTQRVKNASGSQSRKRKGVSR
jgi:hypothetical protein